MSLLIKRQLKISNKLPSYIKTPHLLEWEGCAIMGILNLTPDSFSDGGSYKSLDEIINQAEKMRSDGALIIDIGGESTRPNARSVSLEEELNRVIPAIKALKERNFIISLDTYKPEVAKIGLDLGVHIINDVKGFTDPEMQKVCSEKEATICIMHKQGNFENMQNNPVYTDVVAEVQNFLEIQKNTAMNMNIRDIILDPGIGFGKNLEHNLDIIRSTEEFTKMGKILIGASRKRLINDILCIENPKERDNASVALHMYTVLQGASIIRVHNVKMHAEHINIYKSLEKF